jgi:hypothetical protein
MDKAIRITWEKNNFPGFHTLWGIIQKKYPHIKQTEALEAYNSIATVQLHKQPVPQRKFKTPIRSFAKGITIQLDLLDMQNYSRKNGGNKYIFIATDVFSRR